MSEYGREDDRPHIVDRRASAAPESAGAGGNGDSLEAQLAKEKARAESYYASWQRAAADYQNFKRRVESEQVELARFASASLVINILPVLDDLERALQSVDTHIAGLTWVDGIRLIHRKFQTVLEMSGVTEIEADGRAFDPAEHEAVMYSDGEAGKVVGVVQKGYKLNGRVIRPAMVAVGKGAPEEAGAGGEPGQA
jgi:molecular chaperone GrpE